jgi:quercetin dioxygenase-like cupin family protein
VEKEIFMQRRSVLMSAAASVITSLLAVQRGGAQESTPSAGAMSMEGLTFNLLGVAPNVTLPSPADLQIARAGFAPGAGFPFDASDPTGSMAVVESGALTIRVEEQEWTISRGAALQQAMATPGAAPDMSGVLEEVAMGAEATLQAGDVAYIPGNLTGEVRNNGQEPASALVFLIAPSGAMMGGTPTP